MMSEPHGCSQLIARGAMLVAAQPQPCGGSAGSWWLSAIKSHLVRLFKLIFFFYSFLFPLFWRSDSWFLALGLLGGSAWEGRPN